MEKLEVQFRVLKGELLAIFPYIIETKNDVICYAHIGQHSSCSWNINTFSKRATYQQYKSLLNELKMIYNDCDLVVIKRRNHKRYLKAYYDNFKQSN